MRMRTTAALALVIPMMLTGCHPDWWLGGDDGSQSGTPVPFETLARGEYSGMEERGERIITSEAEWDALWSEVNSNMTPMPERPDVDFSTHTVIGVFQGENSSGGHKVTITSMAEKGGALDVNVKNTHPSGGCIVTQALTQPYHIVMVGKKATSAAFSHTTESACNE